MDGKTPKWILLDLPWLIWCYNNTCWLIGQLSSWMRRSGLEWYCGCLDATIHMNKHLKNVSLRCYKLFQTDRADTQWPQVRHSLRPQPPHGRGQLGSLLRACSPGGDTSLCDTRMSPQSAWQRNTHDETIEIQQCIFHKWLWTVCPQCVNTNRVPPQCHGRLYTHNRSHNQQQADWPMNTTDPLLLCNYNCNDWFRLFPFSEGSHEISLLFSEWRKSKRGVKYLNQFVWWLNKQSKNMFLMRNVQPFPLGL